VISRFVKGHPEAASTKFRIRPLAALMVAAPRCLVRPLAVRRSTKQEHPGANIFPYATTFRIEHPGANIFPYATTFRMETGIFSNSCRLIHFSKRVFCRASRVWIFAWPVDRVIAPDERTVTSPTNSYLRFSRRG
jgi:hypothetical protein